MKFEKFFILTLQMLCNDWPGILDIKKILTDNTWTPIYSNSQRRDLTSLESLFTKNVLNLDNGIFKI